MRVPVVKRIQNINVVYVVSNIDYGTDERERFSISVRL